jgi:hypothetical protein
MELMIKIEQETLNEKCVFAIGFVVMSHGPIFLLGKRILRAIVFGTICLFSVGNTFFSGSGAESECSSGNKRWMS